VSRAGRSGFVPDLRKAITRLLGLDRWRPASDTARAGERAAARKLKRHGYRILARNLRLKAGEADLVCIAPDRRTVVVVEVKARKAGAAGPPPETRVGSKKARKLKQVARELMRRKGLTNRPVRIDVVGVDLRENKRPAVRIYMNAISG